MVSGAENLIIKPLPAQVFKLLYSVYILRSKKDHSLYNGYSANIKERVKEHNDGRVVSTRDKKPWELIYAEIYKNRIDAMQREKYFKTGWGRNYIKNILHNTLKSK